MGAITKLIDAILFVFFAIIAVAAPLIDSQTSLPSHFYPDFLINLKKWYAQEFGDYLFSEKPHFLVAIVWLELLFQWPLSLLNLYAILSSKPWLRTTCLLYGASTLTSTVAIMGELMGSGKASDKLMMLYLPFLGSGILAILRGLIKTSSSGIIIGKRPSSSSSALPRKKRA